MAPWSLLASGIEATNKMAGNALTAYQNRQNATRLKEAAGDQYEAYKQAYDDMYGPGSFNAKMQEMGTSAADEYQRMINDQALWNEYLTGNSAYQAPEAFSFTAEDLYSDPSYQFRLKQGQDALSQNQVAGGLNLSGAAAKQMNDYTQNVASTEYANAYRRANDQYNTDRQFDFNAWLTDANRYYDNLTKQLQGQTSMMGAGINASNAQTNARMGLAGQESDMIGNKAVARNAEQSAWPRAFVSSLGTLGESFNVMGSRYKADNIPTLQTNGVQSDYTPQQQDMSMFMNGYNPYIGSSIMSSVG